MNTSVHVTFVWFWWVNYPTIPSNIKIFYIRIFYYNNCLTIFFNIIRFRVEIFLEIFRRNYKHHFLCSISSFCSYIKTRKKHKKITYSSISFNCSHALSNNSTCHLNFVIATLKLVTFFSKSLNVSGTVGMLEDTTFQGIPIFLQSSLSNVRETPLKDNWIVFRF